jgi:chromosomal replication initiation ATPase DnaA
MIFPPKRLLTLSTFFPRDDNQVARAAGIEFIGASQPSPDVLIVAGPPGSGKTHLLHALANFAKRNEALHGIACLSAVQFADEVARGLLYSDLDEVLGRYAGEGLMAIDDVDRICCQPEVGDAFLKVIQMRQVRNKRTLLTASLSLSDSSKHPLMQFLDHQPAVRLI